jgi:hypothetical protein
MEKIGSMFMCCSGLIILQGSRIPPETSSGGTGEEIMADFEEE